MGTMAEIDGNRSLRFKEWSERGPARIFLVRERIARRSGVVRLRTGGFPDR
jgi:hypothetical protein